MKGAYNMKLPVSHLIPGMRLSRSVYGQKGQLLLRRGMNLTSPYISSLSHHNVLAVSVESMPGFDDMNAESILEESIRSYAMASLQRWVETNRKQQEFAGVIESVNSIVHEIVAGKLPFGGLAEICTTDVYTFAHSIDVCAFSVYMGINYGYRKDSLLRLGVGGILHDLGKAKIPPEILNKPGKFTDNEFEEIKKHPILGYNMLSGNIRPQLSNSSLEIVLSHHERYDGSGYPNGLKGEEISDMATICAMADVYSAMTTDRVYRKAFSPNEAYEMIMACGDINFKFKLVKLFAACISPYPVDTLVSLSTGQVGCVIATNRNLPFRPIITILETKEVIDMSKELAVVISRSLTADEAQAVIIRFVDEHSVARFVLPQMREKMLV